MSVKVLSPIVPRTMPEPEAGLTSRIDWSQVRDVVRGRLIGGPRAHAIASLVAARHPGADRDLQVVLQNPAEPVRLRVVAALNLVRLDSPQVESILIAATRDRDEHVLAAVMRALGRVGTERGLRAIEAATDLTGVAARQAAFAASLISHRLGLEGHDLPVPRPKDLLDFPEAAARTFQIQRLSGGDADHALRTLSREPFGIAYDESALHEIRCADNRWLVAFNRDVTSAGGIERLAAQKTFAGVLATYQRENDTYSARHLILTAPEQRGRRVRIHVQRLLGEPGFFGRVQITAGGDRHPFSIRAVAGPGSFPVLVDGFYRGNGRLEITTARTGLFISVTRRPQPGTVAPGPTDPGPAPKRVAAKPRAAPVKGRRRRKRST